MIIKLHKYLCYGTKEHLDHFFANAQRQGFIEFIPKVEKKSFPLPEETQLYLSAIKLLRKVIRPKDIEKNALYLTPLELATEVVSLFGKISSHQDELKLLEAEMARVAPFGDFSIDEIEMIEKVGRRKIQFFCMKTAKSHKTNFTDEVIYVGTDYDLDFFITINEEKRHYPDMIEMHIDRPLGVLKKRVHQIEALLKEWDLLLKTYRPHLTVLETAFAESYNHCTLTTAKKEVSFPLENGLFFIEAWVPETKIDELFHLGSDFSVHFEEVLIEKEERVPTYMENKGFNRVGEDLVVIYDVPSTSDLDPSSWVVWAFALFFAMIINDAGYGLVYLGMALFMKFKNKKMEGSLLRLYKLFKLLSISCIIWGVLACSYFGVRAEPGSGLSKVSFVFWLSEKKADYHLKVKDSTYQGIIHQFPKLSSATRGDELIVEGKSEKNGRPIYEVLDEFSDSITFEFALFVGIVHIMMSLARYARRNFAALGWILAIVGGYLYFPSFLQKASFINFLFGLSPSVATPIGLQLLFGGSGLAILGAIIQKKFRGLDEVLNSIQIFSDILSYLRLYALGLAGAIMASTFNDIGREIGLVLGCVVILIGHIVNLTLSTIGGVIHGLRLNFLEWFRHCFEGGGRLFNPLHKISISKE